MDYIFGDDIEREITRDDLKHMTYLEMCIKETLRMFPPAGYFARNITEPFQIGEHTVPAGCTAVVLCFAVHYDYRQYKKPIQFIPERFAPENTKNRSPFAFIPFSAGLRNCIGQRFAMLEMKMLLAIVLRKYQIISYTQRDKLEISPSIISKSKTPIKIEFIKKIPNETKSK